MNIPSQGISTNEESNTKAKMEDTKMKMTTSQAVLLGILLLALGRPLSPAQNLIYNGDFELPGFTNGPFYQRLSNGSTNIAGWTVSDEHIGGIESPYWASVRGYSNEVHTGTFAVQLTARSSIGTSFPIASNTMYEISFWVRSNDPIHPVQGPLEVSVAGFTINFTTPMGVGTNLTIRFIAPVTDPVAILRFRNTTPDTRGAILYSLDTVSATIVVAPPPPICELVLAETNFDDPVVGADGWRGQNNDGGSEILEWLNPSGDDGYIQLREDNGDSATMLFVASDAYLGDKRLAYGGRLTFNIRQRHTDQFYPGTGVTMESGGMRLNYDLGRHPRNTWDHFEVPLVETAGWTRGGGQQPATRAEMLQVLAALDRLTIRGEYSRREVERTDLDHVQLIAGTPSLNIAYAANEIHLSWPSAYAGFHLEAVDEITGTWRTLVTIQTVQADTIAVRVDASVTRRFFRLVCTPSE